MSKTANSPRVTYRDIIAFREKIFDELTEMRKDSSDEFAAIRVEISEIRVEIKGQDEKFKGLIRRDTIGYVWDSLTTLVAAATLGIVARWRGN